MCVSVGWECVGYLSRACESCFTCSCVFQVLHKSVQLVDSCLIWRPVLRRLSRTAPLDLNGLKKCDSLHLTNSPSLLLTSNMDERDLSFSLVLTLESL